MHSSIFKQCLVLLVLFHLGSSSPHREGPPPSRSAPSLLDDFPEDYVIFNGHDSITPSIGPPKLPPAPKSTPEPLSTADQRKKL